VLRLPQPRAVAPSGPGSLYSGTSVQHGICGKDRPRLQHRAASLARRAGRRAARWVCSSDACGAAPTLCVRCLISDSLGGPASPCSGEQLSPAHKWQRARRSAAGKALRPFDTPGRAIIERDRRGGRSSSLPVRAGSARAGAAPVLNAEASLSAPGVASDRIRVSLLVLLVCCLPRRMRERWEDSSSARGCKVYRAGAARGATPRGADHPRHAAAREAAAHGRTSGGSRRRAPPQPAAAASLQKPRPCKNRDDGKEQQHSRRSARQALSYGSGEGSSEAEFCLVCLRRDGQATSLSPREAPRRVPRHGACAKSATRRSGSLRGSTGACLRCTLLWARRSLHSTRTPAQTFYLRSRSGASLRSLGAFL
jgi:hypothetical protein